MEASESQLSIITQLLSQLIKDPNLNPDENLLDSGKLTSLTSMNLLIAIEDRFQIKVPNQELNRTNFSSLRSLNEMVDRLLDQ